MSLAPASSLGAFLKARLAVNGIQCAARSFGTLTAAGRGLLSSMGASCVLETWRLWHKVSASLRDGNANGALYSRIFGGLTTGLVTDRRRRPRTPRPRNPRYRATIAAIAEMRLRAARGHGRSRTIARPVRSGAAGLLSGYGGPHRVRRRRHRARVSARRGIRAAAPPCLRHRHRAGWK